MTIDGSIAGQDGNVPIGQGRQTGHVDQLEFEVGAGVGLKVGRNRSSGP